MGSVIIRFGDAARPQEMTKRYTERSGQSIHDEFHDRFLSITKFARVNGTGSRLSRDAEGNVIGLLGIAGIWDGASFVTNLSELLRRYSEIDDDDTFINDLWGNFVLFIYLKARRELKVFKDFSNSIDFYLVKSGRGFYLGNSSLALAESLPVTINRRAIAQFLTSDALYEDVSFFNEIVKLKPASIYTITTDGKVNHSIYHRLPTQISSGRLEPSEITLIVEKNLLLATEYCKRLGLDVSGGYDTRLILSVALHAGLDFLGCVHGEDDGEVRFVKKKIARKLHLPLRVLKIGRGKIDRFPEKALRCHFLFDGSLSVFDAVMEGCRSFERMKYCDSKVNAYAGELLRDRYYASVFRGKTGTPIRELLRRKILAELFQAGERELCEAVMSREFADYVRNGYKDELVSGFEKLWEEFATQDPGYLYYYPVYLLQYRAVAGAVCGSHNRIVLCSAPLNTRQFVDYVLPVRSQSKRNARIQLETIHYASERCSEIPLISGYPCQIRTPRNSWNYWIADQRKRVHRVLRCFGWRLFGKHLVFDHKYKYDYKSWLSTLYSHSFARHVIEKAGALTEGAIDPSGLADTIRKAQSGRLPTPHYRTLGKVISLALTCEMARNGEQ